MPDEGHELRVEVELSQGHQIDDTHGDPALEECGAFRDENLRGRYLETTQLAASYTKYLDTLNGLRRLEEIRRFRSLDYAAKCTHILALCDSARRQLALPN